MGWASASATGNVIARPSMDIEIAIRRSVIAFYPLLLKTVKEASH
jgi:hypothetical protein